MTDQIAPANANGIEIAYETFGDPADPTLLLVMGLGVQMLLWDEELCQMFVERGFHVVRFDNRDVGLSTKTPGRPPRVLPALVRRPRKSAYLLSDMADDAAGLLDHLQVDAAHVMGASMGGMIAQTLAARHPRRVLSLVSIMSTTGNRRVGRAKPGALALLVNRPPQGREENVERAAKAFKVIGSPGFERDEARLRDVMGRSYDRCFHPAGVAHQLVAIMASGNRTPQLRSIQAPTLVVHGENDPLVGVSGGRATARAIPDARLMTIPGMGHDMPREIWPRMVDAVVANAQRARAGHPGAAAPMAP
jgi:pimeloyl-ACP methyl ester carboxylesterase